VDGLLVFQQAIKFCDNRQHLIRVGLFSGSFSERSPITGLI